MSKETGLLLFSRHNPNGASARNWCVETYLQKVLIKKKYQVSIPRRIAHVSVVCATEQGHQILSLLTITATPGLHRHVGTPWWRFDKWYWIQSEIDGITHLDIDFRTARLLLRNRRIVNLEYLQLLN